ncbi:MAG: AsnC family transcriptional regulator [Micromonosporaceae bacterium]|nr:AsnC family transcriptional regulator [Micromonosporaceae bacterium]
MSYANNRRPPEPPTRRRPATPELDEVDKNLLRQLARDGRKPNNALAADAGIAPSTCLGRVRSLRERGLIRGYHADIDLAALGAPLQGLIAVRLTSHTRDAFERFRTAVRAAPGVQAVFYVSGETDFLVHVACADTDALREFLLDHITSQPDVANAYTSIVFDRTAGYGLPD